VRTIFTLQTAAWLRLGHPLGLGGGQGFRGRQVLPAQRHAELERIRRRDQRQVFDDAVVLIEDLPAELQER
jgi:hypothetical protein